MKDRHIYLDDQGGKQMSIVKDDVSPCMLLNGAKAHGLIVCKPKYKVMAFAQNTREEVRAIGGDGNVAGCVSAESGTHQTTYVCIRGAKDVLCGTKRGGLKVLSFDSKQMNVAIGEEVCATVLATAYKEPPAVIMYRKKGE